MNGPRPMGMSYTEIDDALAYLKELDGR